MGKLGPNEFLLRLAKDSRADMPAEFSSELGLTTRRAKCVVAEQRKDQPATSPRFWA